MISRSTASSRNKQPRYSPRHTRCAVATTAACQAAAYWPVFCKAAAVEQNLRDSGAEVVSVLSSTSALLFQIEQHRPDVVLIDIRFPGRDILESLAVVSRHNPVIDVALLQFRNFQALREELSATREQLETQKQITRAKALLMKQKGLDEEAAHKLLLQMAMEHNLRLADVTRMVIATLARTPDSDRGRKKR